LVREKRERNEREMREKRERNERERREKGERKERESLAKKGFESFPLRKLRFFGTNTKTKEKKTLKMRAEGD